jgi:hypothetical protein
MVLASYGIAVEMKGSIGTLFNRLRLDLLAVLAPRYDDRRPTWLGSDHKLCT